MENMVNLATLDADFRNKKVFVTGHTGFKGSWLTACLHLAGACVKGYALPPEYNGGLYDVFQGKHLEESVFADIRDKDRLAQEIRSFQPDFIFHLAAQPLVRRSYEIPSETFEVNAVGTAHVLEALKELQGACTVIIVTTDKVYENREKDVLYHENDVLGGYDPYSASKACAELVVNSFRSSFFNPSRYNTHHKAIASARAGNVIGGGDWSQDRIIPDIVRALQQRKSIQVRNPNAVRPWQHVLEPIGGYLLLASMLSKQPLKFSRPYNFGPLPGDHLTVKEVVEQAIKNWGSGDWVDRSSPTQPHEAGLLKLDISRATEELNWKPKWTAATAIDQTIRWYKQPVANQAAFTINQIKEYFAI